MRVATEARKIEIRGQSSMSRRVCGCGQNREQVGVDLYCRLIATKNSVKPFL